MSRRVAGWMIIVTAAVAGGLPRVSAEPTVQSGATAPVSPPRSPIEAMNRCLAPIKGLRWKILANKLQAKMAATNLSPQQRLEWEADIAAVRLAELRAARSVTPSDPSRPVRYLERLTPAEQMAASHDYEIASAAISAECAAAIRNRGKRTD